MATALEASSTWQRVRSVPDSALGGVDWSEHLSWCDPYFVWSDLVSKLPETESNQHGSIGCPSFTSQIFALLRRPARFRGGGHGLPDPKDTELLDELNAQALIDSVTHSHVRKGRNRFAGCMVARHNLEKLVKMAATANGRLVFEYIAPRLVTTASIASMYLLKTLRSIGRDKRLHQQIPSHQRRIEAWLSYALRTWSPADRDKGLKYLKGLSLIELQKLQTRIKLDPEGKGLGQVLQALQTPSLSIELEPSSVPRSDAHSAELDPDPLMDADNEAAENEEDWPEVALPDTELPARGDRQYNNEDRQRVRLCIVDDRFSFASPALGFLRPQLDSLWHQGGSPSRQRDLERGGFGRAYAKEAQAGGVLGRMLDLQTALARSPTQVAEPAIYRLGGYIDAVPRWSHGSVVLHSIADQLKGLHDTQLPIVRLVQLPPSSVLDTSGGTLSAHVLDAIHDSLQRVRRRTKNESEADKRAPKSRPPVVVNLSYGHHGGAHDGQSVFERAVLELLERHPELHVVVPAGNTHLGRAHACERVALGSPKTFRIKVAADNPADTFVELWCDDPYALQITVTPPQGPPCASVPTNQAWVWRSGETVRASIIFPEHVAQSPKRSMALLAIGPTRRGTEPLTNQQLQCRMIPERRYAEAPHGVWTIRIGSRLGESQRVDAWIQRGDVAPGREGAAGGLLQRQAYFLDPAAQDHAAPDPHNTLNGIAGLVHERYHVVGASYSDDGRVSQYSAAGPTRNPDEPRLEGPDLNVPVDRSLQVPGWLASGMLSSARTRTSGTSMAAAIYAGQLARFLATNPDTKPVTKRDLPFHLQPWSKDWKPKADRPVRVAPAPERAEPRFRGGYVNAPPDPFEAHPFQHLPGVVPSPPRRQ